MPPLHPVVVHFPLALLPAAALLEVLALLLHRDELSRAGWWTQLLGTLGLGLAVVTGIVAGDTTRIPPPALQALDLHEQTALLAAALFFSLLLWRVAVRTRIPGTQPWVYVGLLCLGLLALAVVGWHGGDLVFHHAIGVQH